MHSPSTESTPRERLARLLTLMRRTRMFWRSALVIGAVGLAASFALALHAKRAWRSETSVVYEDAIKTTTRDGESSTARAARLGPKLKDLVYARPRLAGVIQEFHLFPEKTAKSMVEAEEEMQTAIGFRARASDTFVISFTYEDPVVAQKVATRLAENMIGDYNRENVDGANLTRDFLRKKRDEASARVDDASRALASFLAQHPQFQWGLNDSPYAAQGGTVRNAPMAAPPPVATHARAAPSDPALAVLERDLARVEAQLTPGAPTAPLLPPPTATEAQKRRDAAAQALAQAQAGLAEKLTTLTPAHPDAIAAQTRVASARDALVSAEAELRDAKAAIPPPPPPDAESSLPADKKALLERERGQLRNRIASRRHELGVKPAATAAEPSGASKPGPKQDIVDLETDWHRLKLDLDRARDELHGVELNTQQADMSADAMEKKSQAEMRVLEPAYRPTKPDKGKGRVFIAGAFVSLFIALAYAGARVLLNDTLLDEGDVAALGGPPVLVAMPAQPIEDAPRARAMVPRTVPEVVRADDEPEVVAGPPPVVVTAAPRRVEPPRQLPPARRARNATIPFGWRVPVDGFATAIDTESGSVDDAEPAPRAALSIVPSPVLAVGGGFERPAPEVEVVGADVDAHGDGTFALLRDATPETLAALRVLRHRLDQRRAGRPLVVSVVSPNAGEGKTSLAVRLAMTLCESDRARVVLVEGNLERPRLARTLGLDLPPGVGLSQQIHDRLVGRGRPWGVVELGPSLAVLAEPEGVAAHPGVIHATQFQEVLRALKRRYDYVVIDGPGVLGSGDANVLEEVSDGVLVVARAASTRGTALARAERQLGDPKILGVVLSGVASRELSSRAA